jgi:hypothetical protein
VLGFWYLIADLNGKVERVGREVLRATRALLSEYRTAPKCMGDDHTYIAIHFE